MSAKHTPGPWTVRTRERSGEVLDCFVTAPDVNGFAYDAEIMGGDEYREDIQRKLADARLIAAAPELLASLSEVFEMLDAHLLKDTFGFDWHDRARAAIAKATGDA